MSTDEIKKVVGYAAAELIEDGMQVGLGTGSTAKFFIERLIQRVQEEKIRVSVLASSTRSKDQAKAGGLTLLDLDTVTHLDITVDGADEIDRHKWMIKGGGGALVREKIVANMSREMVVIVDESKVVEKLGQHPLPVEIVPFAHKATEEVIKKVGYRGKWRKKEEGSLYVTDNGNYILDVTFASLLQDPQVVHEKILHVPGVVDTGFFFHLAGRVFIGKKDKTVEILS